MLDSKYRTIIGVALPLMVSGFVQSVVYLTDASMLSRFSTLAFDASGNAGLLYVTVFIALMSMSDGLQILIARRIGEVRQDTISRLFNTGLISLFIISLLLFAVLQFVIPTLLPLYSRYPDLTAAQLNFLDLRSWGLLCSSVTLTIMAYLSAQGKTWLILLSAILTASSNVILDYFLIFGAGAFPRLGLEGAAIASSCADGIGMMFLLCYLIFSGEAARHGFFRKFRIHITELKAFLKVGSPMFFQGFTALATWTVFFSWIEQTGKHELTVSQNIRAVYFLAFIPISGFAATTKTYVSQYIGAQQFDELKKVRKRIRILTFICLFCFFHGAVLYPEQLIGWINPAEAYIAESADILLFVSGSIFIYGLVSVQLHTISGSGNTNFTFLIEMACVLAYLLSAWLLIKEWKSSLFWIWSVEYVYFILMGILTNLYLYRSNWKYKKI